jgi:cation diffusion facilitator CzcD-associated flavoprotein CzcO
MAKQGSSLDFDVIIVGAGASGLAAALQVLRTKPGTRVAGTAPKPDGSPRGPIYRL